MTFAERWVTPSMAGSSDMPVIHLSSVIAVIVAAYFAADHELAQVIQAIQDWGW